MSEEIENEELLVSQLGSEYHILDRERFDYYILSNLRHSTENPDTLKPAVYFATVRDILKAKKQNQIMTFGEIFLDNALKLNISVGGRGRRDLLLAEQVRRGIAINQSKEIPKPTAWDKLFRRQVVEEYEKQEKEKLGVE